MSDSNSLASIKWVSEDTVEVRLGPPVADQTLIKVEKLTCWFGSEDPIWLIDYCYGFGVLSMVIQPELISIDQISDILGDVFAESTCAADSESDLSIEIPVCYDPCLGLDLKSVSDLTDLSVEELIDAHCSRDYRVLATGFVPGFAYLGETDQRIHLPRRDVPRTRVPAGSVAIAENQTVIYPKETPGGWHIIGRMPGSIVSLGEQSIDAKLSIGMSVRFKSISVEEFSQIEETNAPH